MDIENSKIQELLQNHQRDINCIIDEDRLLRKRGLTNIQKGIFESKQDADVVIFLFQNNIVKNLLKCFEDKIEKHREIAYQIIEKLLEYIPGKEKQIDRDLIINLMRVFSARLNQIPFPEQSEHIRLTIIKILQKLLNHYPEEFLPILADISVCVSKALQDAYPDLKKQACLFIIDLSQKLSKHIGHHNTQIVKALGLNLKHQHNRVRKQTLQALTEILLTQSGGGSIEHIMSYFQKIVADQNNEVRKTVFESLGKLLIGFSIGNLKQYESELLQLLLNGLSDDILDIVTLTQGILEEVGLKRKVLAIEMGENVEEIA